METLREVHPMGILIVCTFIVALLYKGADVLDRRRMKKLAEKEEDEDDQDFTF
jgi:hypothetical protein